MAAPEEVIEDAEKVEEIEESEDVQLEDDNDTEGEEADGEETGEPAELEPWEETGEEDNTEKPEKSLKAKKAWKREREAVNEELERLKAENEALKTGRNKDQSSGLKRPDPLDFENDDDYEDAKEAYLIAKVRQEDKKKELERKQQEFHNGIKKGVDKHNERVGDFLEERNVDPEVYRAAESVFIKTLDEFFPGKGEANADYFLSMLGEGSEKIPYFLGRNKTKLAEFRSLLKEDPNGIKAAMFLGRENLRLNGGVSTKPKTKAPKPAKEATGDTTVKTGSASEKALKKKYDEAHKSGNSGLAFSLKRQAKREHKIDTSKW